MPECQVFSQPLPTNFQFRINLEDKKWENNNSPSSEYSCITPIRALELKKNNPEMWSRLLLLMDADEDRKIDNEHREMLQVRRHLKRHLGGYLSSAFLLAVGTVC